MHACMLVARKSKHNSTFCDGKHSYASWTTDRSTTYVLQPVDVNRQYTLLLLSPASLLSAFVKASSNFLNSVSKSDDLSESLIFFAD